MVLLHSCLDSRIENVTVDYRQSCSQTCAYYINIIYSVCISFIILNVGVKARCFIWMWDFESHADSRVMPLQSVVYYGHYMYTGYTHISYTVLAGLVTCWAACRWFVLFTGPKLDQFASFVQRVGVLWLETEMAGYFQNIFISFKI